MAELALEGQPIGRALEGDHQVVAVARQQRLGRVEARAKLGDVVVVERKVCHRFLDHVLAEAGREQVGVGPIAPAKGIISSEAVDRVVGRRSRDDVVAGRGRGRDRLDEDLLGRERDAVREREVLDGVEAMVEVVLHRERVRRARDQDLEIHPDHPERDVPAPDVGQE